MYGKSRLSRQIKMAVWLLDKSFRLQMGILWRLILEILRGIGANLSFTFAAEEPAESGVGEPLHRFKEKVGKRPEREPGQWHVFIEPAVGRRKRGAGPNLDKKSASANNGRAYNGRRARRWLRV